LAADRTTLSERRKGLITLPCEARGMAIFDEIDATKALPAQPGDDRTARLARTWFAEAHAKSVRDDEDFAAWNRERKKWTNYDSGGDFGYWPDTGGGDGGGD
jgi:hypothetical protein